MSSLTARIAAATLAVLSASTAQAQLSIVPPVNLYTPALTASYQVPQGLFDANFNNAPNIVCSAVNVSSGNRSVRIRIRAEDGTVLQDSGNFTIAPMRAAYHLVSVSLGKHEYDSDGLPYAVLRNVYCQFTFVGDKSDLRASASIRRTQPDSPLTLNSDELVVSAQ